MNIQTASAKDIENSGAIDLSDFMNRNLNGVYVNNNQENPFQPDLNYRGYTASPLLGTPEGMSVYVDGVRQNQPFGDVVAWDLIPKVAIQDMALVPGSDPVFGLNTLGAAVTVRTKDGRSTPLGRRFPSMVAPSGAGRYVRAWRIQFQRLELVWRRQLVPGRRMASVLRSPSQVRQVFGKAGLYRDREDEHFAGLRICG